MTVIYATTNDLVLAATRMPRVSCNNQNSVKLHVDFDTSWNGYAKSAVFYTSKDPTVYEVILSADGECLVPTEVLIEEATLYIGVSGVKTAPREVKSSTPVKYKVLPGTPSMVMGDPSPSVYQQLLVELATERARLNNLIANGGAVEGDEVADARVGYNGKIYPNLYEAITGQVCDINADLNDVAKTFDEFGLYFRNYDLVYGTMVNGVIKESTYKYRAITPKIFPVKAGMKIEITDDAYKFGYAVYDTAGTFDGVDHGWNRNTVILEKDGYIALNFGRVDESEMTEAELEYIKTVCKVSLNKFGEQIEEDIAAAEALFDVFGLLYRTYDIVAGSMLNGNIGINPTATTRAVTPERIPVKAGIRIEFNSSVYNFGYACYDKNGVFDGVDHGWNTETVELENDGYIVMNFRRNDEGEMTEADYDVIKSICKLIRNDIGTPKQQATNDIIASVSIEYGRYIGASYVFARIPKTTNNGRKVKPHLALTSVDGTIDGTKVSALKYSKRNKAAFTINAGLFNTTNMQPVGQTIINGVSLVNVPMANDNGSPISDYECYPLCIDADGNLSAPYQRSVSTETMLADGIKQAVTGWGKVVDNFAVCYDTVANEIVHSGKYIRQVIGQFQNGDYFVCTVDMSRGNVANEAGITYENLAQLLIAKGVKFAYSLDGGGSAETVIGQRQLNPIYEGTDGRAVPTIIAFEAE